MFQATIALLNHLPSVEQQEDDILSVLQLLLMWIVGTTFVLLLNFMPT
jgi:hypothetical protein